MKKIQFLMIVGLLTCATVARAGTYTVINTASDGAGSFSQAIRDANADPGSTINFAIPGTGPFYIAPPVGGFPLIYADGTTVDGTSQPGWVANTAPITATNNSKIMIVLKATGLAHEYFRDMAYVYYGSPGHPPSDPVIDNTSMVTQTPANPNSNFNERGGYDPDSNGISTNGSSIWPLPAPYAPGECAILGVYRSQNATIKGIAFLGWGPGHPFSDYAIAVAQDYGLDPTVHNVPNTDVGRWTYDNGTSRGLHVNGCYFGIDPGNGSETNGSVNAISAYRHRDKNTGGTRPELANCENFVIGVKPGAANPRAQFNVFSDAVLSFSAEGSRFRMSGNQFLTAPPEIGRYNDTQIPAHLYGTDGDGVNDAEEGNLYTDKAGAAYSRIYNSGNKLFVWAGNYFGINRDGTRATSGVNGKITGDGGFAWDQRSHARFGSDFDGVSDALEANTVYNTKGFLFSGIAPDATAYIGLRGNVLSNNVTMPLPDNNAVYTNYMTPSAGPTDRPVISTIAAGSLTVTYPVEKAVAKRVFLDVYKSDPTGDLFSDPEGMTYLGSFEDTSLGDGTVTWGAAPIVTGDQITVAVHYARSLAAGPTTITSSTVAGGNFTLTWTGTANDYDIRRASSINGPWGSVGGTTGGVTTFTTPISGNGVPTTAFFRIVNGNGTDGQTSPFAVSLAVP